MVSRGPRPDHRRGTTGRVWNRYRAQLIAGATGCCYCKQPFVTTARCDHPRHAGMVGCPTHPKYPTVEHVRPLIEGGVARDPNGMVAHFGCNSARGGALSGRKYTPERSW